MDISKKLNYDLLKQKKFISNNLKNFLYDMN